MALVLAVVGLYGSLAYTASQRTREIGIRIALGASSHSVMQLVLSDAGRLAVIGLVAGIGTAILASGASRPARASAADAGRRRLIS